MKILLEVVDITEVKGIQQKLNQWSTTKLLKKFDVIPLNDNKVMFRILLRKES